MSRVNWNMTCPLCGKTVHYWPNYSETTSPDYGDVEWIMHGKIKQFFHRSCYMKKVILPQPWCGIKEESHGHQQDE